MGPVPDTPTDGRSPCTGSGYSTVVDTGLGYTSRCADPTICTNRPGQGSGRYSSCTSHSSRPVRTGRTDKQGVRQKPELEATEGTLFNRITVGTGAEGTGQYQKGPGPYPSSFYVSPFFDVEPMRRRRRSMGLALAPNTRLALCQGPDVVVVPSTPRIVVSSGEDVHSPSGRTGDSRVKGVVTQKEEEGGPRCFCGVCFVTCPWG